MSTPGIDEKSALFGRFSHLYCNENTCSIVIPSMKPLQIVIFFALVSLLSLSCRKDREGVNNFSCDGVARSLVMEDVEALRDILEPMMASLEVADGDSDAQSKLLSVVEFLDECNNLEASLLCFECVYATPPQSEISVKVSSGSNPVTKIIDISRDNNGKFRVVGIHN